MALINCPECGKQISDQAPACIHCGFPMDKYHNEKKGAKVEIPLSSERCPICRVTRQHVIEDNIKEVCSVCGHVFNEEFVKNNQHLLPHKPAPVPTCPKCGSTSITTSARGVDGFWGFLGASSTVNRCANCGYAWYPETGKSI